MTASSTGTARITAGQTDAYRIPHNRGNLPALIYFHGVTGNASEMLGGAGVPSARLLVRALVLAGWPVVSVSMPVTWGNATTLSRYDSALTFARTAAIGAHASKPPVLLGVSHGTTCALTVAYNRTVAAVAGILPAVDLQAIRVADTLSLRAGIDSAWGVTYPTALPAGADPATHTAQLSAVPQRLFYSSDDAVSVNLSTYATATGASIVNLGALGHTDTAVAAVNPPSLSAHISQFA